jgi:hypothetical protein
MTCDLIYESVQNIIWNAIAAEQAWKLSVQGLKAIIDHGANKMVCPLKNKYM